MFNLDLLIVGFAVISILIMVIQLSKFFIARVYITSPDVMIANLDYPDEITNQRKAIKNAQLEDEKQAALAKASIKQAEIRKQVLLVKKERHKSKLLVPMQLQMKFVANPLLLRSFR